jgi:hypothetical protein
MKSVIPTAVNVHIKNAVLQDVTTCSFCKTDVSEKSFASIIIVETTGGCYLLLTLLLALLISSNLIKEAIYSSETSVLTRVTRRHMPEKDILYIHRRKKLESYKI